MSKPILTIAIPAYNVELYLEETVLSVAKSKYAEDIEILIVNDGSSDSTLQISDKLAKEYTCVKVINKQNGGHGSTINAGIKHATGKYFRLLDGDDWFNTEEFDKYIRLLKDETSDIVLTDLMECFIKSNINRPTTYYGHLPEYQTLYLDNINFPEWGPMLPTTTIKTELLKKFDFKIDEHCYYVDQEYNLACYLCAKTATYYPLIIYHYRLERDGQSMEKASLIKNASSHEKVCSRLLKEYHSHLTKISKNKQDYISERILIPMCHMQYAIAIEWCKSKTHFLSFDNTLQKYPSFYNNPGVSGTLTNFHRKTKGIFIKLDHPIRSLSNTKNKLLQSSHTNPSSKKTLLFTIIGACITILIANLIVINYVNSEQTIYYWDTSGYWKNSIELLNTFKVSFSDGIKSIVSSMSTDYNHLPLVPMLPLLNIFGTSRLAFMLISLNIYVIPFAFVMYFAVKALFIKTRFQIKPWVKPIIFTVFCVTPTVLIPVLNGRPDAICLVVIAIIFYHLAKTRLECISNYFTLGILVFLLIVLRRYFSFWGISLYLAILLTKTILNFQYFSDYKTAITKSIKVLIKLFASGCIILLLMFIFSRNLLERYLTGNYSDIYSGYMLGSFFDQILLFIKYYGIIFISLAVAGMFYVYIRYRKTPISELVTIMTFTSIFSFLLFTRVQTLGDQHMYMFVPFLTMMISIFIIGASNLKFGKIISLITPVSILLLSFYSFTGTRMPNCSNLCYIMGISESIRPSVRTDLDTINSMHTDLESTMKRTDYLYILASSDAFNDDLFRNLNLPDTSSSINISGVKHVDKRDGFPYYFFDATYIAIADPIQTHLSEGSQDIIAYLSQQILIGNADNLSLIKTYHLDNNIKIKIYHKDAAYSNIFLQNTKEYFQSKYPNYPSLYETIPVNDQNNN